MTDLKMIMLKNGTEELEVAVISTMFSLRQLMAENPIALFELREICRDSKHQLFGDTRKTLYKFALVGSDGTVHETVRNVVLSAIEGEMLQTSLTSPIAE